MALGRSRSLLILGILSGILGLLLVVGSFLNETKILCLLNRIPGRLIEARFCHYPREELEGYLRSFKHKEGELLKALREKEEEFYQKSWELTEEARNTRKEVAIEEPRELTELRFKIIEVQDTLRALSRTETLARLWTAIRLPLRISGIAFLFFASLLLLFAFRKKT
jgi:hypothetical protein